VAALIQSGVNATGMYTLCRAESTTKVLTDAGVKPDEPMWLELSCFGGGESH